MTKKPNKPTRLDNPFWVIAFLVSVLLLGVVIGASLSVRLPLCAEIAVTGTKGVSTMALDGDDLYLTGVKMIRCAALPEAPATHPGF